MIGSFRLAGDVFPELARLQQHLDQMFHTRDGASIRALARNAFPAVNVGSSADAIEVVAFAPGIDPGKLQITVDKGLLTVAGERSEEARSGDDKSTVYAQERFSGSFKRVVSLPDDADPSKVDASLRDGVLRITIAKRESSKPRQITVN